MAGAISFSVGAIFEIEDLATPTLGRLSERFAALQEQITGVQESMTALGRGEGLFSGINEGIDATKAALQSIVGAASEAGNAIKAAMTEAGAAADATAARIRDVAEALAAVGAAAGAGGAAAAEAAAGGAAGGLPSMYGPRGGAGGGWASGEPGREVSPFYPIIAGAAAGAIEHDIGAAWDRRYYDMPIRDRGDAFYQDMTPRIGGPGGPLGPSGTGPSGWPSRGPIPLGSPGSMDDRGGGRGLGRLGHTLPLIEGVALYEAMHSAASEEQSVAITLLRGFHLNPAEASPEQKQYLMDLAREGAVGTKFSEAQVAAGMPILAAPLGFLGEEGMKKFGGIFPTAVKAAEAASQLHFGTFEGSLRGAIEFAHQMQQYTPEGFTKSMNMLGAVTETIPGGDMEAEARAMSYIVPQARALGADPMEAMAATGFLQRAGLRGTVGATTLRQMLVGLVRTGGPLGAHVDANIKRERAEFERGFHLEEGLLSGTGKKGSEHEKALKELGLTDEHGKVIPQTAGGGIDIDRMMTILAAARTRMTPLQFGQAMYNFAGIRGQAGGEVIAESLPQYGAYKGLIADTAPLDEQLKMINITTSQLTGQATGRLADVGNAIGDSLLPALRAMDEMIITLSNHAYEFARGHPIQTAAATVGGVGLTAYLGWMGFRGMIGSLGRYFGWNAGARVAEGLSGAAAPIVGSGPLQTAIGWMLPKLLGPLSFLHEMWPGPTQSQGQENRLLGGRLSDRFPQLRTTEPLGPVDQLTPRKQLGANQTPGLPMSDTQAAPSVTVTVGPINMNGVADEATFRSLLGRLTEAIKTAIVTATTHAGGTSESPYVSGGAGP